MPTKLFPRTREAVERVAAAADDLGAAGVQTGETMRVAAVALVAVALVAVAALAIAVLAISEVRRD